MKREWNQLLDEYRRDPRSAKWGMKLENLGRMQYDIFRKNLSLAVMRRLAATCETLPVQEKDPDAFELNALQFMVRTFIDAGDREVLVTVLSTHFPEYLGGETTTKWYLLRWSKQSMKDPVLVLGEAYARSKEPEVRRKIAAIVREGFANFDIPGKDDAEYVRNAMLWYTREKDRLMVRQNPSPEYPESFFELKKEAKQPTR